LGCARPGAVLAFVPVNGQSKPFLGIGPQHPVLELPKLRFGHLALSPSFHRRFPQQEKHNPAGLPG